MAKRFDKFMADAKIFLVVILIVRRVPFMNPHIHYNVSAYILQVLYLDLTLLLKTTLC